MNATKVAMAMVLAAVAAGATAQPREAKAVRDALTGDARAPASANPQCALYAPAELERYAGTRLAAGRNAAAGSGCQWVSTRDDGDVMVQVVDARYHTPPRLAPGYKPMPAVGQRGYVLPEMGGWVAATVVGDSAVLVSVSGPAANEANAIALLQETLRRRAR